MLVLVGAYRSLGGAPPRTTDSALLLRSLHEQLRTSLAGLVTELDTPAEREPGKEPDSAKHGRKLAAAVQQALDSLPPPDTSDQREATARTLLGAAAEDTGWAWRLVQAGATSPALAAAATVLTAHAAECCDQAAPLLTSGGEPGDGA